MEVAGSAFPITPLLSQCTKIVTILHNVGKRFKRAPMMMTSVATECNLVHVALAQLRTFDWAEIAGHIEGRQEALTRATEAIILGCTLTLSVIEEYAIELQDYVENTPISPTEQMGIMARVRVLWKEDEMRELLLQLRGYQTGLTGLIRAAHDSDFDDVGDILESTSNSIALLQRSRSSRARKPLSIQAAMAQAATYTSMSSSTAGSDSHTSRISGSSNSSRTASTTAASKHRDADSFSAVVSNSYDRPEPNASRRKTQSKRVDEVARHSRPAFLSMNSEDSDTIGVKHTERAKRSRDQMRKSSPTVGERFKYKSDEIPVPEVPSIDQGLRNGQRASDNGDTLLAQKADVRQIENTSHESLHDYEPPRTAPPNGPLPDPPTQDQPYSPRVRSPTSRSSATSARNSDQRPRSSAARRKLERSASPPKQTQFQTDTSDEDGEPARGPSPTPSVDKKLWSASSSSSLQNPRKQRSDSSVRDQIIMLPETARLRKQASGDLLRDKSSSEMLEQSGYQDAAPRPSPNPERPIVGNAFGRQGSNDKTRSPHVSRSPSYDVLSDNARKRAVADSVHHASLQETSARARRERDRSGHSRTASGSATAGNLHHLDVRVLPDDEYSPTSDAATTPSSIPSPADRNARGVPEPWPLGQEQSHYVELSPRQTTQTQRPRYNRLHSDDSSQAASPSQINRGFSPQQNAPRTSSRSTAHYSIQSGRRSRSNTLLTIESDAGETDRSAFSPDRSTLDIQSTRGSTVPSVLSSQWGRSPQDQVSMGPRMSHAEDVPWELVEDEHDQEEDTLRDLPPSRTRNTDYDSVPHRTSSRLQNVTKQRSPPRSPLLTDGFLSNTQSTLPKDHFGGDLSKEKSETKDLPQGSNASTGASMKSSSDQKSSASSNTKTKKAKKPSMRERWANYKQASNQWYQEAQDITIQESVRAHQAIESDKRSDTRASIDNPGGRASGAGRGSGDRSLDRSYSMSSASGSSNRRNDEDKTKKKGFMKGVFSNA